MRLHCLYVIWFLVIFPAFGYGQDCFIRSKANDINPDQLCSPVEVVTWEVSYMDVNDAGTLVQIFFDWDDGSTQTLVATEIDPVESEWVAIASHTYISNDDRCNYHPIATLMVDGVLCTSSSQEQIVTIWDNDNTNGGRVNASPDVYPICVGNAAVMQFDDNTLFNCVPPQEEDVPNNRTRWIQWVYGTTITMTGADVMVDGVVQTYPFEGPVTELTGPVTGSNEQSLPITVADDKLVGQEFEVELRYWNYCNPYPSDLPVRDRSVIRIIDHPDATITPVDTLCEYESNFILSAATSGGTWSGVGIVNANTGEFSPSLAGIGTFTISYEVTAGNSCSSIDTEDIVVRPGPNGSITPAGPFCAYAPPYDLEAASSLGTWTGTGITNTNTGLFDPGIAGPGRHIISFESAPDANGCVGNGTLELLVMEPPDAEFLTTGFAWCEKENNQSLGNILISGSDSSTFELIIDLQGSRDTLRNLSNGPTSIVLENSVGQNLYTLVKIIEYQGGNSCETDLFDTLIMQVHPMPDMELKMTYENLCSPVEVNFETLEGLDHYIWDFGDGITQITTNSRLNYTYHYDQRDWILGVVDGDTIYGFPDTDTVFHIQVLAVTEFGCSDTVYDSIHIYPSPNADFFVNPLVQDFPDSEINLLNLSSPGNWFYLWDFGDSSSDTDKDPMQHNYIAPGVYDVQLTSFSPFCRDSMIKSIRINPPPPQALFEPDTAGCPPLDVTFRNQSLYADTYVWDFDDGTYSIEASPTHKFWESKKHHVKLVAYGLSGADTTEKIVLVHPSPTALFEAYPREAKNLNQVFKFMNNSINSEDYLWDFGDGNESMDKNASHVYQEPGMFTVSLYVWSDQNCPDTLVLDKLINVMDGEGNTLFPNAFVWNGSGPTGGNWGENAIDNTVFHPHMENAIELHMIIYSRWGEKIWETNEVYIGWDGYLKSGELVQPGVYVYKAWVTYRDGQQELLTGDVTFLH